MVEELAELSLKRTQGKKNQDGKPWTQVEAGGDRGVGEKN